MEYYLEYPIRCKTCNEQIACYSYEYEEYLKAGYNVQQALDQLGLMNFCCRISMKDPVIVTFNMENREVIEGIKKIDSADAFGTSTLKTAETNFDKCIETQKTEIPLILKGKGIQPLAAVDLSNVIPIGTGIDVDIAEVSGIFTVPETVGLSTINQNNLEKAELIPVGAGKESKILNGRTYLAR
jgi:DNA-directed RNA polymerase subunit N (RpoN/RPB10)